jgi:hypothetical protein
MECKRAAAVRANQDGFVVLVLLMSLVPMLLVVGAFCVAMTGKSNELRVELDEERALMAAESGVDDAIYRGQNMNLLNGVTYTRTLGTDLHFEVAPKWLKTDGKDNDKDGFDDEADEDVFQVIVTGWAGRASRRIAAYLGPVPPLPAITSAFGTMDQSPNIDLKGTPMISGDDVTMAGVPTGAQVPGLAIATPATTATLSAELTGAEPSKVTGLGGAPSLGTIPPLDLNTLVAQLQNVADIVLTSSKYSAYNFGNGQAGITHIAYRNGNVEFKGGSQGAGILLITGNLTLSGNFRFDGVIIVLGSVVNSAGTTDVYGAILQGEGGSLVETKGTLNVHYSSEAIALANTMANRYVSFNGWQELAQ